MKIFIKNQNKSERVARPIISLFLILSPFFLEKSPNEYELLMELTPFSFAQFIIEVNLIYNPFMGSGTTGRVCDKLERSFVGYDLKGY